MDSRIQFSADGRSDNHAAHGSARDALPNWGPQSNKDLPCGCFGASSANVRRDRTANRRREGQLIVAAAF
jgi:hypothetical protein